MRKLSRHIALILLTFTGLTAVAQVSKPAAHLDRSEIRIGEQAVLTLSVEFNETSGFPEVVFPAYSDTLTAGVEIVQQSGIDTVIQSSGNPDDVVQLALRYTLTSFDSGSYQIGPFPVVVNKDSLLSNTLALTVYTVQIDTTQQAIFDIKEIYEVELSWKDYVQLYWMYGLAVLLLIIAGFVLYRYLKKRGRIQDQPAAPVIPKLPPHVIALKALGALDEGKAWTVNQSKKYHTDLTDILREYIERRFLVEAHEQTTAEILRGMRLTGISEEQTAQLGNILRLADLVKFAKEKPTEEENKRSLRLSISFVEQTIPADVDAESNSSPDQQQEQNAQ